MKQVTLAGTAHEVCTQYGKLASEEILFSIYSYKDIFHQTTGKSWAESCKTALQWLPVLQKDCPDIFAEMEAMAAAAGLAFEDILALNQRSDIALTHYTNGCTSIAQVCKTGTKPLLLTWLI